MQRRYFLFLTALLVLCAVLCIPALAGAASINGAVWFDKALDGQYQEKNGLGNVSLTLENRSGVVATTETGKDGSFSFAGLNEGEYRITAELPGGYVPTVTEADSALLPSDGETARTEWFYASGQTSLYLGAVKSSVYVSLISFIDQDSNGGRRTNDPAVRDIFVELLYTSPTGLEYVVASGSTGKDGTVTLRNLSPGTYQVRVTLPENYIIGPKGLKVNAFYNCFNPSDSGVALSDSFTLTKGSLGMGIGVVQTGNAQGIIWYDENGDGKRDGNESGLSGVTVALISEELSLTREAQTEADGSFLFTKLQPGTYTYRVTLPDGYMFTVEGDSQFTDGYSATASSRIAVTAESTSNIPLVGVTKATSLLVHFYHDMNADGTLENENAYTTARIEALVDGKIVAAAETDANGDALIPIIRGGDVTIRAALTGEGVFSNAGEDNAFAVLSAVRETETETYLISGEGNVLYAAVTYPASVSGHLFADENNNGLWDTGESGAGGFTVQAIDAEGRVVAETMTDENGAYSLSPLLPNAHAVRFLLTDPYIASPFAPSSEQAYNAISTQNSEYGETGIYALDPSQNLENVDGGIFKAGTVSGFVKTETDGGTIGVPGITVTLMDENGEEYSSYTNSVTDENGEFYIKGILPGTYTVRYELPADVLFADTNDAQIFSAPFTSGMGTQAAVADAYAVRTATVSGYADNGAGEPISAVITLTPVYGSALHTEQTVENDDFGFFTVSHLRPGEYNVTVALEDGLVFSYDTCSLVPAAADSVSVSAAPLVLSAGQTLKDRHIIGVAPAQLDGVLYYDENNSGEREGDETLINGFAMTLVSENTQEEIELITDDDGAFASPQLIPGDYLLKLSLPDDCILVNDGAYKAADGTWVLPMSFAVGGHETPDIGILQYAELSGSLWSMDGEKDGLAGLTVSLYAVAAPQTPAATAVTAEDGAYVFRSLCPDEYYLTLTLPENHLFARTMDASSHTSMILADTDAGASGRSEMFYLAMGEKRSDADIGIGAKGEIGDFAWLDENGNGMQDIGEKGIPGIVIAMYQYGELVAETETDSYGHYFFDNLYPGEYTMRVTMPAELKTTVCQTEFPLVGSILLEGKQGTATVEGVIVPSGGRRLSCDLGFVLVKAGQYPASMENLPTTDWSYGGTKND